MATSTLREKILDAMAGSSSQNPVNLKKLQATTKIKLTELTPVLDSMYLNRELQYCSGIKDGEAYTAYWLSGIVLPAWGAPPRKDAVSAQKSATEPARKGRKAKHASSQ